MTLRSETNAVAGVLRAERAQPGPAGRARTLRQQAGGRRAEARAGNRHLHQAITEFEAEVAAINAHLSDLAAAPHRPGAGARPAARLDDT